MENTDPLVMLRAVLADPLVPGGEGSNQAIQAAIDALSRGDTANADAALATFQTGARHTPDFMATTDHGRKFPGGSGDAVFSGLRRALLNKIPRG